MTDPVTVPPIGVQHVAAPIELPIPAVFRSAVRVDSGRFGTVYRVEFEKDGVSHIGGAKCLSLKNISTRGMLRLVRELEMITRFQFCSQVVCLHSCFRSDAGRLLWIVMDYIPNTLYDLYPSNPFIAFQIPSLEWTRYVIAQIFLALRPLHREGCVHRDLSPRNILIDVRMSYAYLADFGLARYLEDEEPLSFDVVSVGYRAPEIALGCDRYTTASDMWSVGVLLSELILGYFLFPVQQQVLLLSNEELLNKIFSVVGVLSDAGWIASTPQGAQRFVRNWVRVHGDTSHPTLHANLREGLTKWTSDAIERDQTISFVSKLLQLDPEARPDASTALLDPFFDPLRPYITLELETQDTNMAQIERRDIGAADLMERLNHLAPQLPS